MRREASIHITESALKGILKKTITGKVKDFDLLVNQILIRAKEYSLSNRSLLATTQKQRKQGDKIKQSSLQDAMTMAKAIFLVRKTLKHRGIEMSKAGSRDWPFIKTISCNANEYCEYHKGDTKDGAYTTYVRYACKKMAKFSLPKLQSMHQSIMEELEALEKLDAYPDKKLIERAYKAYNQFIIKNVGSILTDYSKMPDKYIYFLEVVELTKKFKITPEVYIESQFEGLAWRNGIPDPAQLTGDKAQERLQKYLYENKVRIGDGGSEEKISKFKSLKNLK